MNTLSWLYGYMLSILGRFVGYSAAIFMLGFSGAYKRTEQAIKLAIGAQ